MLWTCQLISRKSMKNTSPDLWLAFPLLEAQKFLVLIKTQFVSVISYVKMLSGPRLRRGKGVSPGLRKHTNGPELAGSCLPVRLKRLGSLLGRAGSSSWDWSERLHSRTPSSAAGGVRS